jgi:hypothetical protein
MNLYKIAQDYENILANTFDPETGEINENAIALLEIAKSTVEEKSIAVASYIKNLDAERKAIEDAKKSMAEREKSLERRVEWLTNYLQSNMERCGISEIKSPYFGIKLRKCPISVDVQDEKIIPNDYKKTKEIVSIDKLKIKEEILAGVVVPGATLKQNNRLEIK